MPNARPINSQVLGSFTKRVPVPPRPSGTALFDHDAPRMLIGRSRALFGTHPKAVLTA
jgi:hypothetical protein